MTNGEEQDKIKVVAAKYGLDWHFVCAIRRQENGPPGSEFGVLAVSAPTFDDQLRVCCASVKHRLFAYTKNPLFNYAAPNGDGVLAYSPSFIDWFASIWAPTGSENDPNNLNRNWANGVKYFYFHLIDAEHQYAAAALRPNG